MKSIIVMLSNNVSREQGTRSYQIRVWNDRVTGINQVPGI